MPRGKKSTPLRGRGGRGGGRSGSTPFIPFTGASTSREGHALSLQEEARNTTGRTRWEDSDQKLRKLRVNFVSAGTYDPPDLKDTLESLSLQDPTPAQESEVQQIEVTIEEEIEVLVEDDVQSLAEEEQIQYLVHKDESLPQCFIIDTTGGERVQTRFSAPRPRSVSPTPSNSSEEIIIFSGRKKQALAASKKESKLARTVTDTIEAQIQVVEEEIHHQEQLLEETIQTKDSSKLQGIHNLSSNRYRGHIYRNKEKDAIIADYIANMDDADESLGAFNQRELGGTSDEAWQETEASSEEPKNDLDGWERSDLHDFDEMSTSDGMVGEVQAIYSKRERPTGIQYLVVMKDQTIDEARWVTAETVSLCCAMELLNSFEAEEKLVAQFQSKLDESTDSNDNDLLDIQVGEVDDQDPMQQGMTDQQIARLLSKQEELGMGSQQLLLFDEAADDEDEGFIGFKTVMSPSKPRGKRRGPNRAQGYVPAGALADAYDGFDIMDFDRPSLKKKPRSQKGKIAFDLSDSELEASMQIAWDNDRHRKKAKKDQREVLRSQGLLGGKQGKADMKEKYKEGMSFSLVKAEIKDFLMGDDTTLALSPMDKADRKIIHEIANAFNLKSKSVGGAKQRFPVLYKTARTTAYIASTYERVEAKWTHRFFARKDIGGVGGKRTGGRGQGGFNNSAVSYQDGDIVGGSAPEIGAENRGRAMLEKMGWSSGTALGALNNKGIMTPVTHIVKNSKAGLG